MSFLACLGKGAGFVLIGEYSHTVDAKGRLNFPAKLREELGDRFIITRGLDHCLNVYSLSEWQELEAGMKTLPRSKRRSLERFFFAGAAEVVSDKQGRIVIPPALRQYATLDKNVVVVGAGAHAEIWDETLWRKEFSELSSESISEMMEELGF